MKKIKQKDMLILRELGTSDKVNFFDLYVKFRIFPFDIFNFLTNYGNLVESSLDDKTISLTRTGKTWIFANRNEIYNLSYKINSKYHTINKYYIPKYKYKF